jgi:hypothetical protein
VAENSGDAPRGRGPGRPFQPGQSGNPGGKPKKLEELSAKIGEFDAELLERLLEIARHGEHKDSVSAIKLLWGYRFGMPRQVVTDAEGGAIIPIEVAGILARIAAGEKQSP